MYGFVNHQGFKQVKKAVVGVGWGGWRGGEFGGGGGEHCSHAHTVLRHWLLTKAPATGEIV